MNAAANYQINFEPNLMYQEFFILFSYFYFFLFFLVNNQKVKFNMRPF